MSLASAWEARKVVELFNALRLQFPVENRQRNRGWLTGIAIKSDPHHVWVTFGTRGEPIELTIHWQLTDHKWDIRHNDESVSVVGDNPSEVLAALTSILREKAPPI